MMKFSTVLLASLVSAVASFSVQSPVSSGAEKVASVSESIDHTMKGADDDLSYDAFDPLEGERPALVRNNKDEVWVPQVSLHDR